MAKSKSEILNDFQEFMGKYGGKYKEWCVGTAEDAKKQLFNVHKFKNGGDKGLYREAESEMQAAAVAEFFTNLGAKGDDSVKRGADQVYAYKMAPHTKQ
jgi:hypothetical protein